MSVDSEIWRNRLGGSLNGDRNFEVTCPENTIMTGIIARSGNKLDKITSIQCGHPSKIFKTDRTTVKPSDWSGGNGGRESSFICPVGSAISKIESAWDTGDTIGYITFHCSDIKNGNTTSSNTFGKIERYPQKETISKENHYIGGFVKGNSGNLVDSVSVVMKDMTGLKDVYSSDEGLLKACKGEYKDFCPNNKSECDTHALRFCKANYGHDLCSCINSKVISDAKKEDITFPDCPAVYDSKCISSGYKLAAHEKVIGDSKCNYMNCKVDLGDAIAIDSNVSVVQTCIDEKGNQKINEKNLPNYSKEDKIDLIKNFNNKPKEEESSLFLWIFAFIAFILSLITLAFYSASKNDYSSSEIEGGKEPFYII